MYGHPKLVKQWAKIMKPDPTPAQVERVRQMREAKARKAEFMRAQGDLFSRDDCRDDFGDIWPPNPPLRRIRAAR